MKNFQRVCRVVFILIISTSILAQEALETEIHIEKVTDKVIIVYAERAYVQNILDIQSIQAINTKKGIVVIDTSPSLGYAAKLREAIEKEFCRKDFVYTINTHSHFDHSFGNQVFSDTLIIGHENWRRYLKEFSARYPTFLDRVSKSVAENKEKLKKMNENSEEAARIRAKIVQRSRNLKALTDIKNGYSISPPDITFRDQMTLDMGDVKINVIYVGKGLHTDDHVFVHIPEERVVFTGDIMEPNYFGFPINKPGADIDRFIEVLGTLFSYDPEVKYIVTNHTLFYTRDGLAVQLRYLKQLWSEIKEAHAKRFDLERVKVELSLEKNFGYLFEAGAKLAELRVQHQGNIDSMWGVVKTVEGS